MSDYAASVCLPLHNGFRFWDFLFVEPSHHQISWNLGATRMDVIMIASLWHLTGMLTALRPKCLSVLGAMGKERLNPNLTVSRLHKILQNKGPGHSFVFKNRILVLFFFVFLSKHRSQICLIGYAYHWVFNIMYCSDSTIVLLWNTV